MTASPISDLNPVFMAARCTITLAKAGGMKSFLFYSIFDILICVVVLCLACTYPPIPIYVKGDLRRSQSCSYCKGDGGLGK